MGVTGFRVSGTIHALPGQLTGWQAGGGRRMPEAGQPVEGAAGRPPRSVDPLRGRQALAVAQRVQQRCAALAAEELADQVLHDGEFARLGYSALRSVVGGILSSSRATNAWARPPCRRWPWCWWA